ncbi:uncharacterized protein CG13380 [Fopius arisanus]|uniref:Uncharacterized protein CG13380 n=1 Tax=Fopius arisanus TaxID=64838 RepID=A0A9R1SVP5_9HYME|nr:PREDICTED: uncharacterized protein CG13380 [Fopius arisanus]XP_011297957.1 PREDICTED: uncharacterized protein CG13380 [Fopius arisanus]
MISSASGRKLLMREMMRSPPARKPKNIEDEVVECPCQRPKKQFICSSCGYIGEGRIRSPCDKHANVIFINDFSRCPICKAYDFMLQEF